MCDYLLIHPLEKQVRNCQNDLMPDSIAAIKPVKPTASRQPLSHAIYLCLAIALVWIWTNSPVLAHYYRLLIGLISLTYFAGRQLLNRHPYHPQNKLILETTVITAALLLIIQLTGGLASPIFFLIYFLLFATALIFTIPTTVIMTIATALFFTDSLTSSRAAMQVVSVLLFSPLAIYFGKQYSNLLITRHLVKYLNKDRLIMSKAITTEESLILPWLTLNFKNTMIKTIHNLSELLTEIGSLKLAQREKLTEILEDNKGLLASGEKLKEEVDKTTD